MENKVVINNNKEVEIGWIYRTPENMFYPSGNPTPNVKKKNKLIFLIWTKHKILENFPGWKNKKWFEDFQESKFQDFIYVYGWKETEFKALTFAIDQDISFLTGMNHVVFAEMVIYLNRPPNQDDINIFTEYIATYQDENFLNSLMEITESAYAYLPEKTKFESVIDAINGFYRYLRAETRPHTMDCYITKNNQEHKLLVDTNLFKVVYPHSALSSSVVLTQVVQTPEDIPCGIPVNVGRMLTPVNKHIKDDKSKRNYPNEHQEDRTLVPSTYSPLATFWFPNIGKSSNSKGLRQKKYGYYKDGMKQKVILLLGATGSGKTTLVNFMATYFKGSETYEDGIIVVDDQSHTESITAYTFCRNREQDIAITIIDTPGLGESSDTANRKPEWDLKKIIKMLSSNSIPIHAVGIVVQSHFVRLTASERLVVDNVLALFGNEVKDNVFTLITFADNPDRSPVVETLQQYSFHTKEYCIFNNSILSPSLTEVDEFDKMWFRFGQENCQELFKIVHNLPQISYSITIRTLCKIEYEMAYFMSAYDGNNIDDIHSSGKKAWDLAKCYHNQLKEKHGGCQPVENVLTDVARVVFKEKSHKYACNNYLQVLSLTTAHGLRDEVLKVIQNVYPLYTFALQYPRHIKISKCKPGKKLCLMKKKGTSNTFKCIEHKHPSSDQSDQKIDNQTVLNYILMSTVENLKVEVKRHAIPQANMEVKDLLTILHKNKVDAGILNFIDILLKYTENI